MPKIFCVSYGSLHDDKYSGFVARNLSRDRILI